VRDTFLEELMILAEKDKDITLITGDLGFGVFDDFEKKFPKQFLNVGVAEQNMTMIAAGMALENKKIFTYSIGNFPNLRCLEHIRNDVCYHDLNVTIIGMGGGFSYGQLGMSHHSTEDLSIMRALPNMMVVAPGTTTEVSGAMRSLYALSGPAYLRLDKSKAKDISTDDLPGFELGKAAVIRDGNAITLISSGGILEETIKAANELAKDDVSCRVLSMHTVKPIDVDALKKAAIETGGIVSVEENNIIGGLGGAIAESCLEFNVRPNLFKRIGLKDIYSSIVGDQYYLRDKYNMNSDYIVTSIKNLLHI